MAGTAPAFKNVKATPSKNGVDGGAAHIAIYDLFRALYYLCNNVDDDSGTVDSDYASKISTPMAAAIVGTGTGDAPLGALDSTVSSFYTPSNMMNWNGMDQADVYCALYDLAIAIVALCAQMDGDVGAILGTDYRANISTPLTATLGSKLSAPAEGLITSTYFYGMEGYMANGCFSQGDYHKCLYDLYIAIVRICTLFDAGAGTMPATLLAGVGTPLNTAIGQFIKTPAGATTTGS